MLGRLARFAILSVGLAVLAIACLGAESQAAPAEKRVALIVGNNDYQNFQPLSNPANDAASLKAALESINFDVVYATNTTLRQFYKSLKDFNKRARDADVAIIYYAGHAVQFHGRNYLIQVDDEAETLDDINIGSIPVDKLLEVLATVKGVRVLVLDACRDNPAKGKSAGRSVGMELTREIGLARLDDYDTSGGRGMVIAYATSASHAAEDGEGKNSPYNVALTKWITAPDLTVPDIFTNITGAVVASTAKRQHPIFDSSLTGSYILNPTGAEWVDWANVQGSTDLDKLQRFLDAHPDSSHAPFVRHQIQALQESLAESTWSGLKDASDPARLQAYREKFPNSPHAVEAQRRIAALQQDAEREAQAWERAKAASDLETVQAFRGDYPNSTHAAEADRRIAALKKALDDRTRADAEWERLKTSADVAALQGFRSAFAGSSHAAEAADRVADLQRRAADAQREATEWGRVKDSQNPAPLQNFLDRYPDSQFAAEANRRLAEAQRRIEVQRSEKAWDQVKGGSDIAALESFRDTYPNSPHAADVDQKIAGARAKAEAERMEKAWAALGSSADAGSLRAFRDRYPNSPHASEADRRIGASQAPPGPTGLQLDDSAAWDRARKSGSIPELQAFMHFFPNSAHFAEAGKAIAALEGAADEAKRRQADAEKARQLDETCRREAADVADFAKAGSAGALEALRSRAACPKTIATIDASLRDLRTQQCASERDHARDLGSDLEALRKALAGFSCDAVLAATRARIGQLEQDAARVAKACDDARFEVGARTDPFEAGAREKLEKYLTRAECPAVLADAQQKIRTIDERVAGAQELLKKLGCYKAEPSSLRFDRETQEAVGRFERWARVPADPSHMTADFMQKLAAFKGEGACVAVPAVVAPPVASIPREEPAPSVERRPSPRLEQQRPPRPQPVERAPPPRVAAPVEQPRPVRQRPPAAVQSAARPAPAAARPSGGAKPQIFIPN